VKKLCKVFTFKLNEQNQMDDSLNTDEVGRLAPIAVVMLPRFKKNLIIYLAAG